MATYGYRCQKCGRRFEKTMSFSEHEKNRKPLCPRCASHKVQQVPSGFQAVTSNKT
jgi:putative FmdB family regulatory protein